MIIIKIKSIQALRLDRHRVWAHIRTLRTFFFFMVIFAPKNIIAHQTSQFNYHKIVIILDKIVY